MTSLEWLAVAVLIAVCVIPIAVWFGIQIGEMRAEDRWYGE